MFGKKKKGAEPPVDGAPAGEDGAEAAPPKKGLPKMLIIGGAAAVLVLGGGGAGAFFLIAPKASAEKGGEHKPDKKKKKAAAGHGKDAKPGDKTAPVIADGPNGVVFYTLPDIVVNMQTADGRPTFLKLKLTFELADGEVIEALEPARPRMQDMFQTFLRELRPEDLAGSQGSYQLRMEILRRVNLVVAPAKINAVLIEEMLIN